MRAVGIAGSRLNACVISTFRCNARCHMCDIWRHPTRPENEIAPNVLAKLPNNMNRVNLTGGEPMLRDDIEDFVEVLYKKAKVVEISTNGYFTEKIVAVAQRFPRVSIRVSVEGLSTLNDRLRGSKSAFDHALRTMLLLKETKLKNIGLSTVLCDKNTADLLYIYKLCAALDIEFAHLAMHNSWYYHKSDNALEDVEDVIRVEKDFIKALLNSSRRSPRLRVKDWLRAYLNLNTLRHIEGQADPNTGCQAGRGMFTLDPEGNIMPCNGTGERLIMGNLRDRSFADIWSGPDAANVRNRVSSCARQCALISRSRLQMKKKPWEPLIWIGKNKIRLAQGKDIS